MQPGNPLIELEHLNPFNSDLARINSTYIASHQGKLIRMLDADRPISPLIELIHDSFHRYVLSSHFSCVMARSAIKQEKYRMGVYHEMGSLEATAGLARDLFTFVQEQKHTLQEYSTFVACFTEPCVNDEKFFEDILWDQLQSLHNQDALYHRWDPTVSSNPDDTHFAFSFAEQAFFVVGLSSVSSRWSRRFVWPSLIFNAHFQFRLLREQGRYKHIQQIIRDREKELQGHSNLMLSDFGEISEARQYSGRVVDNNWHCPFYSSLNEE